jgi:hypothetical protein
LLVSVFSVSIYQIPHFLCFFAILRLILHKTASYCQYR